MSMGKDVVRRPNLFVVLGAELTAFEIEQITTSLHREFKISTKPESLYNKIFFLLKDREEILAMAGLWEVKPFVFADEEYTVHALVEVVANVKGAGYGKRVVSAIHDYLLAKNLSGIGFCSPKNKGFYEKCGFSLVEGITKRFVYRNEGQDITNQDGQIIFYLDSSDELMKKVLAHPSVEVSIPTAELW